MNQQYKDELVINQNDELDNRQIADMNIEGMPGYRKKTDNREMISLTKKEARAVVKGALKAGLLVGAVFWLAILLIFLFCVFVWF